MNPLFGIHNTHRESPAEFARLDPQLRALSQLPLVHRSAILDEIPLDIPGIYTITGGRQVGKTTLLKQWIARLLTTGVPPTSILFLTGEIIDDQHALLRILREELSTFPAGKTNYVLLDEVTYVRDWDKAIKFLADAGLLDEIAIVITGSDMMVIREARMRLPGRRGRADRVDFHLHPLSFRELVDLKGSPTTTEALYGELENFLLHGGYLTAINDMASNGEIAVSTLHTYSDWIRGDVMKRNKQERYLHEILGAIVKRQNSQVTWNALSRDLSIDHAMTVASYVELLERMDVLLVRPALLEHKLAPAPKKARKVSFLDPFVFHAVRCWISPTKDPFENLVRAAVHSNQISGDLIEACVASHFARRFPTYYIKQKSEVDIAYIDNEEFWPVEVKWSGQIRAADLKQAAKYRNAKVWAKIHEARRIEDLAIEPLPVALYSL